VAPHLQGHPARPGARSGCGADRGA
jgi:hypothetical protein